MWRFQLLIHDKANLFADENLLSLLGAIMRLVDDHYAVAIHPQAHKQGSTREVFGVEAEARRRPQFRGRCEE